MKKINLILCALIINLGFAYSPLKAENKKLSGGAIAGIAVGSAAGLALIIAGIVFISKKFQNNKNSLATKDITVDDPVVKTAIVQAGISQAQAAPIVKEINDTGILKELVKTGGPFDLLTANPTKENVMQAFDQLSTSLKVPRSKMVDLLDKNFSSNFRDLLKKINYTPEALNREFIVKDYYDQLGVKNLDFYDFKKLYYDLRDAIKDNKIADVNYIYNKIQNASDNTKVDILSDLVASDLASSLSQGKEFVSANDLANFLKSRPSQIILLGPPSNKIIRVENGQLRLISSYDHYAQFKGTMDKTSEGLMDDIKRLSPNILQEKVIKLTDFANKGNLNIQDVQKLKDLVGDNILKYNDQFYQRNANGDYELIDSYAVRNNNVLNIADLQQQFEKLAEPIANPAVDVALSTNVFDVNPPGGAALSTESAAPFTAIE